jgi:hypothetical protein
MTIIKMAIVNVMKKTFLKISTNMNKLLNRLTLVVLVLIFSLTLSAIACSKSDSDNMTTLDCMKNASLRREAVCKDRTQFTATGSGACSGHGGDGLLVV